MGPDSAAHVRGAHRLHLADRVHACRVASSPSNDHPKRVLAMRCPVLTYRLPLPGAFSRAGMTGSIPPIVLHNC
eukprot:944135-Rhodomonas_salina.3